MTEEEKWQDVWSFYWQSLPEPTRMGWEAELNKAVVHLKLSEVCRAVRELGASDQYQSYAPKIGALVAAVKRLRKTGSDLSTTPESSGAYCKYCKTKGWISVPIVYLDATTGRHRLAKYDKDTGEFEPGTRSLSTPCGCDDGIRFYKGDDVDKYKKNIWRVIKYLTGLPDGARYKL